MAEVLLGSHNTGDVTESYINATPSWTGNQSDGKITITTSGTVTKLKMKLRQNSAVQSPGTMTVELRAISGDVLSATGTFDLTSIPKGDPAAWYTITMVGSPEVFVNDNFSSRAQRDQSTGITPAWQKHNIDAFMWEIWGDELSSPTKATNPTPADAASNVTLDQATIAWDDGGGSDTYNVYYGVSSGNLSLVSSAQVGTSFNLAAYLPFAYNVTRYWRIDSTNAQGTTTGDEWSFSTIAFAPVLPTGVTLDGSGNPTGTATGENNIVTIRRWVAAANNKIWYEDL